MLRMLIGLLWCVATLAACTEKLSKDEAELLDAMIFVSDGIEDNTKEDYGLEPWRRQILGRTIQYSMRGKNGVGSSDADENAKIRDKSLWERSVISPLLQLVEERAPETDPATMNAARIPNRISA